MKDQKGSPRFARVEAGLAPILIVLLIAAAVGGYLIYSGKINLKQNTTQISQPSPTTDVSPVPDGTGETANWKTYTGETLSTTDGSSLFTIKYPTEWLLEGHKLYPFGKNDLAFNVALGAGGRGAPPPQEEKKFPTGVAKYYWSKNDIAGGGYATFDIDGESYIFEITVPADKSDEYEKIFNEMLKTFKPL